jgi:hypothetical protein
LATGTVVELTELPPPFTWRSSRLSHRRVDQNVPMSWPAQEGACIAVHYMLLLLPASGCGERRYGATHPMIHHLVSGAGSVGFIDERWVVEL